jgi:hypothetical protein
MTQGRRYLVVGLAVLVMGALRLPFERRLAGELEGVGLLPERMRVQTGEKIGQTFYAVSLGGLRTLVATIFNLRAFGFFEEQKWARVGETYELIVDLAPRTMYYWDTGSWHQAYNAASYYLYDSSMPALRRKYAWRDSILLGRDFLDKGVRNNPDSVVLRERLGFLYADPNKMAAFGMPAEAFEKSYDAYMKALETGRARSFTKRVALYSLARIPGREKEALAMAREIKEEQEVLPPTMMCLLYLLSYHEDSEQSVDGLMDSIFPSRQVAYQCLSGHWQRTRDRYPVYGVAAALGLLEKELGIPEKESVLKQDLSAPMDMDGFFTK